MKKGKKGIFGIVAIGIVVLFFISQVIFVKRNAKINNDSFNYEASNQWTKFFHNDIEVLKESETKNITVRKVWNDENNINGKRPNQITVNLFNGDTLVETMVITENDNWEGTFENLPKFDGDTEINYVVSEEAVSGYVLENNEHLSNTVVNTNINFISEETNPWTKNYENVWESGAYKINNSESKMTSKEFVLKEDGNIEFDWAISSEGGYDKGTYVITNVITSEKVKEESISGGSNNDSYDTLTFNHVQCNLSAGTYKISFLYKKDGSNSIGLDKFFVKNAYFTEFVDDMFRITNKYDETIKDIHIKKIWNDENDKKGKRPDRITINLKNGDNVVASKEITAADNWEGIFENIPKFDGDDEINYTISEDSVLYYEVDSTVKFIQGKNYTALNLTTSGDYPWEKLDDGTWQSGGKKVDGMTSSMFTEEFLMERDGNLEFDWAVSSEGNYDKGTYIITELDTGDVISGPEISGTSAGDKYENIVFTHATVNLKRGRYKAEFRYKKDGSGIGGLDRCYVKNVKYQKFYATEEIDLINKYDTSLKDVFVKKYWNDDDNNYGKRPESLIITLMKGDVVIESKTITSDSNWECTFKDVPKYENGVEIEYSVVENDVTGYILEKNIHLNQGINDLGVEFLSTGDYPWTKIDKNTWQSGGSLVDNMTSRMVSKEFTLNREGLLEFDWAISSESSHDECTYVITNLDNSQVINGPVIAGNSDCLDYESLVFSHQEVELLSGRYKIEFIYSKDTNISYGMDKAFIRNIHYPTYYDLETFALRNKIIQNDEKISISVKKEWNDNSNKAGKRPESVIFKLKVNGIIQDEEIVLNQNNSWIYTIENLDKTDIDGVEIDYQVVENELNNIYYFEESNVKDGNLITITNKFAVPNEKVQAKVKKVWEDNNNEAGKRPENLKVVLYANNQATTITHTLNNQNGWEYTFENLDKYDENGDVISYTVQEELDNSNYEKSSLTTKEEDVYISILTNTYKQKAETKNITVIKAWDDSNNKAVKRPNSITVNLKNGDTIINSAELNNQNNWSYTFENMPQYDENNNEIEYSAEEINFNSIFYKQTGNEKENDTITITNKFEVPSEKITLDVEKVWNDSNNEAEKRPESIEIQLKKNGNSFGNKVVLNSGNNWSHTFENLEKYDENGDENVYSVDENLLNNIFYTQESNIKVENKVTITNKFNVPDTKISVKAVKVWDDSNNKAGKRPDKIEVELSNGTKYELSNSDAETDNKWVHVFENLPKYDLNGNEINYSIVENFNDENYETASSVTIENGIKVFTFTNKFVANVEKINIDVEKVWDDNNNFASKRPSKISVKLSDGKSVVGEATLNAQNGWKYKFENLPKFDANNNEITYNATEIIDSIFYKQVSNLKENNKITIKNKFFVPNDTVDIVVNKIWDDNQNKDNKRPNEITVIVKNTNGEEVKRANIAGNVSSNEGWIHTFTGLSKYDSNGNEIKYSIDEINKGEEFKLYVKSINGNTITNTYKLKNPIIKDSTTIKEGPEYIYSSNEVLDYTISYSATICDFYGDAKLVIVDSLPYEIDEKLSSLDGGIYNKNNKTITWTDTITNVDTFVNGDKVVNVKKNFKVKYIGLDYNEINIKNIATTKTELNLTDVTNEGDDDWTTKQSIFGKVISKYLDIDKNNEIADQTVLTGRPGTDFKTNKKDIDYYNFVKVIGKTEGEFAEETSLVNYYYKKLKYDIGVNKIISNISIDGNTIDIEDNKPIKLSIKDKNSKIYVYYKIRAQNNGEIDGKITLEENIPEGAEYVSGSDGWYIKNGKLYMDIDKIGIGESLDFEVGFKLPIINEKGIVLNNVTKILKSENDANFDDDVNENDESIIKIELKLDEDIKEEIEIDSGESSDNKNDENLPNQSDEGSGNIIQDALNNTHSIPQTDDKIIILVGIYVFSAIILCIVIEIKNRIK